jgi:hypothetical protein
LSFICICGFAGFFVFADKLFILATVPLCCQVRRASLNIVNVFEKNLHPRVFYYYYYYNYYYC